MRLPTLVISLAVLLGSAVAAQAPALKIVVIEGEGGVNIIQQKTAVRPLVEVRDRNNLPVSGVAVTFTVGGRNAAFAGGVQTLTVTTNAAGQAAAGALIAISSGAFQIQVQAAYQGQLATAAISQTNFATAAAAAQAGASAGGAGGGGSASGAAGGAAGVGGGISATTIAIVGAAVGGGAIAAMQVAGGATAATQVAGGATAATPVAGGGRNQEIDTFNGSVNGQMVFTNVGPNATCIITRSVVGSLKIEVFGEGNGGTLFLDTRLTEIALAGNPSCIPSTQQQTVSASGPISGPPSAITFSNTCCSPAAANAVNTIVGFKGSVSGTTLTGTLTIEQSQQQAGGFFGSGSTTINVTLTK